MSSLYRATRGNVCAGWVEQDGELLDCAPILRRLLVWPGDRALRLRLAGWEVELVA